MQLKLNEGKKIKTIYEGLLEQLKEERRTWPNQLNNLERAINAQREELNELNAMNHDAQIAREAAKAELSKLEQSVYERKKERERELAQYKKQAEEKKDHAEKVEKRVRTNKAGYKTILLQCDYSKSIWQNSLQMAKWRPMIVITDIQKIIELAVES